MEEVKRLHIPLDIQRFAEGGEEETANQETGAETKTETATEEKAKTFQELLDGDKKYQSEFDKRVSQALETAKEKWQAEADAKRTEAEKLAKMDAEQKLNYELKKIKDENAKLQNQLNADGLYKQASSIMGEKEIPSSYLDLFDFRTETAETIKSKIELIETLRTKDREQYLNNKLKETGYKEVKKEQEQFDPYIEGFKSAI